MLYPFHQKKDLMLRVNTNRPLRSNHPLAHLMQSVFGLHDQDRYNIHLYATSPSDGSSYRQKIETESQHFVDVSSWAVNSIVDRITEDQIHICEYPQK